MFKRTDDGIVKIHGWYLESIEDAWNAALEEAAQVIENQCHDDMTRAEEAAAIRALKEKQ